MTSVFVPAIDLMLVIIILLLLALVNADMEKKGKSNKELISTINRISTYGNEQSDRTIANMTAIIIQGNSIEINDIVNSEIKERKILKSTNEIYSYKFENKKYVLYLIEKSEFFYDTVISILNKNGTISIAE
jgi:hypothetical protein